MAQEREVLTTSEARQASPRKLNYRVLVTSLLLALVAAALVYSYFYSNTPQPAQRPTETVGPAIRHSRGLGDYLKGAAANFCGCGADAVEGPGTCASVPKNSAWLTQSPHRVGLERLGNEEGRLGTLAREQALWEGGHEDHRHAEAQKHFVDRLKARAAIGEMNVSQDEARPLLADLGNRLAMRAGNAGHAMTQAFNQRFEIHGNERLVLDDEDIGRRLLSDLLAGLVD